MIKTPHQVLFNHLADLIHLIVNNPVPVLELMLLFTALLNAAKLIPSYDSGLLSYPQRENIQEIGPNCNIRSEIPCGDDGLVRGQL
jgi:hypothetical protein